MTLEEIRQLVVSADPAAYRYEFGDRNTPKTAPYTVWREIRKLPYMTDDRHEEAWAFQIDRFTRTEGDTTAASIMATLDADIRVTYRYEIDYEPDTHYIHHIYDCEGY